MEPLSDVVDFMLKASLNNKSVKENMEMWFKVGFVGCASMNDSLKRLWCTGNVRGETHHTVIFVETSEKAAHIKTFVHKTTK